MDTEKKKHFIGFSEIIFAAIAAAIFTIGRCVYVSHSIFILPSVLKEYALLFAVLFIPFLFIFALAGKGVRSTSGENKVYSDKLMWLIPVLSALLIAAACVVAGLCLGQYYFIGDIYSPGGVLSPERYPVVHTLLRQLFRYPVSDISLDSSGSIAYLTALALVLGFTCGYTVRREMAEGFRKLPLILTILYFAVLVPFLASDRMHPEESLFFCAVMMLFVSLARTDKEEKGSGIFVWLFLTAACLLRYNFIPAAIVLCISLLFKVKKKGMKSCIIASWIGITTVIAIILAFYYGFGLREIREKDMMSIPVTQVAAVYSYHAPDLTIAEEFIIDNYMNAMDYAPGSTRYVLNSFNEELYLSDRSAFWDLYMHLAKKYPEDLINAFLNANTGIWQPGKAGIPLFMVILGLYIALKSKRPGYSAGITAVFVLWLTYLFGPECRYYCMDPFNMLIPAVLLPVFSAKPSSEEAAEESGEDADDGILDDDELTKEIAKMESEEKKEIAKKAESEKKDSAKKPESGDKKDNVKKDDLKEEKPKEDAKKDEAKEKKEDLEKAESEDKKESVKKTGAAEKNESAEKDETEVKKDDSEKKDNVKKSDPEDKKESVKKSDPEDKKESVKKSESEDIKDSTKKEEPREKKESADKAESEGKQEGAEKAETVGNKEESGVEKDPATDGGEEEKKSE